MVVCFNDESVHYCLKLASCLFKIVGFYHGIYADHAIQNVSNVYGVQNCGFTPMYCTHVQIIHLDIVQ